MIPISLKIVYTVFVCVLVPVYWRNYGPVNFLWFSDIALLLTVPALWREDAHLTSMMAVAVVVPELVWNVDFFARLFAGRSVIGLSAYMFDPKIPLFVRALSSFHIVLPVLLIWMVYRLGYDQRAWLFQSGVACLVLPLSHWLSNPRENVNWVYGLGEKSQTIVAPPFFVLLLMIVFPLAVYLPTHLWLGQVFSRIRPR